MGSREALRFDVPSPMRWQSADRRIELRLVARRHELGDPFGLFYLTIPNEMLKPGEPCMPGVRSLGQGSRRWFCLNPHADAK